MVSCRKCGNQIENLRTDKCKVCDIVESGAQDLAGQMLLFPVGLVLLFLSSAIFVTSLPPWEGAGNEFAPYFNVGSLIATIAVLAKMVLGGINLIKMREELTTELREFGGVGSSAHRISRYALFLGSDYILMLIGGVLVIIGVAPLVAAVSLFGSIDVFISVLPIIVGILSIGIAILTMALIHRRMTWNRLESLNNQPQVSEYVSQEH